jgi:hypothetical protein
MNKNRVFLYLSNIFRVLDFKDEYAIIPITPTREKQCIEQKYKRFETIFLEISELENMKKSLSAKKKCVTSVVNK